MRNWYWVGLVALAVVKSAPSHVYRIDTETISTLDDGTAPITDTTLVSAVLTLSLVDSLGKRIVTLVVDSAWLRHSTGADRTTVPQLEPRAVGMTYRAVVAAGKPDSVLSFKYNVVDPPVRVVGPLSATFRYLFPGIRPSARGGDHWFDSTNAGGTAVASEWTILGERDGVFEAKVVQKIGGLAANADGEHVASEGTVTREIRSTIEGPVLSMTVHSQTTGSGASPMESLRLTFSKSTVTRIVQVR